MEKDEILKRNKAIAIFMGGKLSKPRNSMNAPRWKLPQKTTWAGNPETIYDLLYNRYWDWLMPVVKEIDSLVFGLKVSNVLDKKVSNADLLKLVEADRNIIFHNGRLFVSANIEEAFLAVSDFCLTQTKQHGKG